MFYSSASMSPLIYVAYTLYRTTPRDRCQSAIILSQSFLEDRRWVLYLLQDVMTRTHVVSEREYCRLRMAPGYLRKTVAETSGPISTTTTAAIALVNFLPTHVQPHRMRYLSRRSNANKWSEHITDSTVLQLLDENRYMGLNWITIATAIEIFLLRDASRNEYLAEKK